MQKKFDTIPKGRPIVSGSGSNTELISWFCDQAVKEAVNIEVIKMNDLIRDIVKNAKPNKGYVPFPR